MFPQAKKKFMKNVLAKDPGLASWMPQEVDRVATAPPRDRMNYDTLDSYMDERLRDVSMKLAFLSLSYDITQVMTASQVVLRPVRLRHGLKT